jgi:hAT family C-terminal dimerisation region
MTNNQYNTAEMELVARLQSMREAEVGAALVVPKASTSNEDDVDDSLDDEYDQPISSEHQAAMNEWQTYQRVVKYGKFFPKKYKKEGLLELGDIRFGVVLERGEDIEASHPFKKCNLADFIDGRGYFDLVKFIGFNRQSFPFIYRLACCLASMRVNEVGCERFFSIAGYVSNPRRTSLKVRHYEALAMLKLNIQKIYVDEEWVVQQYMHMEKNKAWDAMEAQEDALVAELELEDYAGDRGVTVEALQLSDIDSMDEEAKGDPIAAVTDPNAFDESTSDDDEPVIIDKGDDKGDDKGNDNDDDTDSELDLDTTLSNLA